MLSLGDNVWAQNYVCKGGVWYDEVIQVIAVGENVAFVARDGDDLITRRILRNSREKTDVDLGTQFMSGYQGEMFGISSVD